MRSRLGKRTLVTVVAVGAGILLSFLFFTGGSSHQSVSVGQVVEDAKAGLIDKISVSGSSLTVTYLPEAQGPAVVKSSHIGPKTDLEMLLAGEGVQLSRAAPADGKPAVDLVYTSSGSPAWLGLLLNILPFLLFGVFLVLIMRQAREGTPRR